MNLLDIEMMIFDCPFTESIECNARLHCHPIPGSGSTNPEFLVLGLNPGRRRGIWRKYDSLKELKQRYMVECLKTQHAYGDFLKNLQRFVPGFHIPNTVYLSDIVKCPTEKGNPPTKMVEQCVGTYLEKTIRALDPKFIIGLGYAPSKSVARLPRRGMSIHTSKITVGDHDYWFISVPHPNAKMVDVETVAREVGKIVENPEAGVYVPLRARKNTMIGDVVDQKLMNLDYHLEGNRWVKGNRVVRIVRSSGFGRRIRISWRERWKDDYAVVYDYSSGEGPICVVSLHDLFALDFVREKRRSEAYANSGFWWSQTFLRDHELAQLVLSFEDRWDIL